MSKFKFSMQHNNRKVMLDEILARLTVNGEVAWVIHYFDGVGIAPNGLSMLDFEESVRSNPDGYRMTASEFASFSESISDLNEVSAIGYCARIEVVKLDAHDSTYWEIWLDDEQAHFDRIEDTSPRT